MNIGIKVCLNTTIVCSARHILSSLAFSDTSQYSLGITLIPIPFVMLSDASHLLLKEWDTDKFLFGLSQMNGL